MFPDPTISFKLVSRDGKDVIQAFATVEYLPGRTVTVDAPLESKAALAAVEKALTKGKREVLIRDANLAAFEALKKAKDLREI